jgi:hypothetical protein
MTCGFIFSVVAGPCYSLSQVAGSRVFKDPGGWHPGSDPAQLAMPAAAIVRPGLFMVGLDRLYTIFQELDVWRQQPI